MKKRKRAINCITLRELINKLESYSCNGEFDDMFVAVTDDWTAHSTTQIRTIVKVRPYYDALAEESYIAIDIR